MRATKTLTTVLAAVIILTAALAAEAGEFGPNVPGRGMGPGLMAPGRNMSHGLMGLERLLGLNLSESQQTELLAILHRYKDEIEGLRDRSMAAGRKLAAVFHAEDFDEDGLRKAFREVSSLKEELLVVRTKMVAELKAVLTREQKALLSDRKARISRMIKDLLAERPVDAGQ